MPVHKIHVDQSRVHLTISCIGSASTPTSSCLPDITAYHQTSEAFFGVSPSSSGGCRAARLPGQVTRVAELLCYSRVFRAI